jgi:hypothetical protein
VSGWKKNGSTVKLPQQIQVLVDVLSVGVKTRISGWWFGTCFIFHDIWDNPSH